jgi:hypothetical protein
VLADATAAAEAGEPLDGFAWIRHGHAACQHGSCVYVWGGVVVREGRKTAGLLVLNTDRMEWQVGVPPLPTLRCWSSSISCVMWAENAFWLSVHGAMRL